MNEQWAVERALKSERELGALGERLSSSERNYAQLVRADADINQKIDSGLRDVNTRLARFEQSLEENRRRDEEAARERKQEAEKRQEQLIAELKAQAEEHKQTSRNVARHNRPFIAMLIGAGLMLQWLIENRTWELFDGR